MKVSNNSWSKDDLMKRFGFILYYTEHLWELTDDELNALDDFFPKKDMSFPKEFIRDFEKGLSEYPSREDVYSHVEKVVKKYNLFR